MFIQKKEFSYYINSPSELTSIKEDLHKATNIDYDYGHFIFINDSLNPNPYGFVGIIEFHDKGTFRISSFGHKF